MNRSRDFGATDDSVPTSIDAPRTVGLSSSSPLAPAPGLDVGAAVGRYVILEELGRGAMGRVLRAYDPKLQREVALKEVHGHVLGTEGSLRLVAEARAMAKLSHPNVVSVYDVEEVDDRLVVVMEYVAGQTLRAWTKAEARGWAEVVRCFRQAGRGLAAAHAAALLHRDFKPDNVLVGRDGVVKVTDFGLAKPTADASASVSSSASSDHEDSPAADDLTRAGTVMGTPRYMAPEQHTAEPLTAAADQYAFCVALWEALWGAPPFPFRDYRELATAKYKGPPPPPELGIPRPIVDALRRGLSPAVSDRWPGMEELLEALAWDPSRRRRRGVLLASGLGVLGLLVGTWRLWDAVEDTRCTGGAPQLAEAWGEERRTRVHDAIVGIGAAYATMVWEHTATELDAYAAGWVAMFTEACEATTVRGEQSSEVMDLRMACLQRSRVELEAVTSLLAEADAKVVSRAHELTGGLHPLERCADVAALRADVEPPAPAEREAVEGIRAQIAEARAATSAGRPAQAKQAVDAAKAELTGVEYGPVRTEVLLVEGSVLEQLGDYGAAEATLREALLSAAQQWQRGELEAAATGLMHVVGVELQRTGEGTQYLQLALGLALRDPVREAVVHSNLAGILMEQARLDEAEAEHRRALELRLEALGPAHRDVVASRNNLANILGERGRYEEAEAEYREVLALWEHELGPDHPEVAVARNNLANTFTDLGRLAEAEAEHRHALAIREAALGPDHPDVAQSRSNLASTLFEQGKYAEAEAEQRRALALYVAAFGPDHPEVAQARITLGNALMAQTRYAEAEREHRRALAAIEAAHGPQHPLATVLRTNLAIAFYLQKRHQEAEAMLRPAMVDREATLGSEHPDMAVLHDNLGLILEAQGRHAEAEAEQRRALAIGEAALGPEHPQTVSSHHYLAMVLLASDRAAEALPHAEFAWAHRQGKDTSPPYQAETAFVLAKALVAGDGSATARTRALGLAERAIETFSAFGENYAENIDDVRAWLREQRGQ